MDKYRLLKKYSLEPGDILFSSFVDEWIRVCELPTDVSRFIINKADCFRLRVDLGSCNRRFLVYRLACRSTYAALKAQVHGATRPRINLRQLRQFVIDLPSLEEQHEIVQRIETLFSFADRLEARVRAAQNALGLLTPALLAKTFRGELVPQDPNDEPASELLERMATSRAATVENTRRNPRIQKTVQDHLAFK